MDWLYIFSGFVVGFVVGVTGVGGGSLMTPLLIDCTGVGALITVAGLSPVAVAYSLTVVAVVAVLAPRSQLGVLFLEGVRDVLEEDEAEDNVFVFRRVHVVAQLVGGEPELGLEAKIGG